MSATVSVLSHGGRRLSANFRLIPLYTVAYDGAGAGMTPGWIETILCMKVMIYCPAELQNKLSQDLAWKNKKGKIPIKSLNLSFS